MPKIDNLVIFRCVQVVRRLLFKNREIGLFCNISGSTLTDGPVFPQLLEFLEANRAIAPAIVLEFTQSCAAQRRPDREREPGRARRPRLPLLARQSCSDLRLEPRELAARGFRFVKVPGDAPAQPRRHCDQRHPSGRSLRPARPLRHRPHRREDRERGRRGRSARLRRAVRPGLPVLAAAPRARGSSARHRRPRRRGRAQDALPATRDSVRAAGEAAAMRIRRRQARRPGAAGTAAFDTLADR